MAAKKKTSRKKREIAPSGASLRPNFDTGGGSHITKRQWYWVGLMPDCPVSGIDIAGVNFPKMNADLIDDPLGGPKKKRIPVAGTLVDLDEKKIELLKERLPRTVIRLHKTGRKDEPGTGQNTGDPHQQTQRGHLITIPTEEEVKVMRERNRATREYVHSENDRAAADYMFAVPCRDQDNPTREAVLPEPLTVTGLEWEQTDDIDSEF